MILDTLSNAKQYQNVHKWLLPVLEETVGFSSENYPDGKIMLSDNDAFLLLTSYETHSVADAVMEAHRQYADVMVMVEGEETILVKNTTALKNITNQYTPEKDVLFGTVDEDVSQIHLTAGSFVVLFPQDAHAPACCVDAPKMVKKIIGKIRL